MRMLEHDWGIMERMLGEAAACSSAAFAALAEELVGLCRGGEGSGGAEADGAFDEAAHRIGGLSVEEIAGVVRFITARFHLLNTAEQLNIAFINRERERSATRDEPRAESVAAAVRRLSEMGRDAGTFAALLEGIDIQPTLTAHPTESRRRSVLDKQLEIARLVERLRDERLLERERQTIENRLRHLLELLLVTDDVRARRLDVPDEVRNGLYFLTTSIWRIVPRLFRDVQDAARGTWAGELESVGIGDLPPVIRYRTWIGGDRDGNPNVTHAVTRETLRHFRSAAADLWDAELALLQHDLSVSTRKAPTPRELVEAVERNAAHWSDDPQELAHRAFEPFRVRLIQMRVRLRTDPSYRADELLGDLQLLRRSLHEVGLGDVAEEGRLGDAIVRARVFGLHIATLDIRQHSGVHEQAVAELLRAGRVETDYESLDEAERISLLRRELLNPRPLLPEGIELSDLSRELLDTLRTIREEIEREPRCIRSYIVSMTHDVSDLLEPLLMMKEVGLTAVGPGGHLQSRVHCVPLFETIDDLERAPGLVRGMLSDPVYRAHLESVAPSGSEPRQEVMLGYSDSNKDGGFLMANVALHAAQLRIAEAAQGSGVGIRYFHGRGGTVGRGGGRAGRAILSSPRGAHTGRLRFTEQGEVISFRYGLDDIAHRHLEQILHATLLAAGDRERNAGGASVVGLFERLAHRSMEAYRGLIDAPGFWEWFLEATPVRHIGALPIASRPVSRATGSELTFDRLRAIPWVFAWIQVRALAPGWYGLGAALSGANKSDRAELRAAVRDHLFPETILLNASQEMARARLPIARRYALSASGGGSVYAKLHEEFESAKTCVLDALGADRLLAHAPVIARSIEDRNPWTDVLNLAQIELLNRFRKAGEAEHDGLRLAIHASINALAAAMQSTG